MNKNPSPSDEMSSPYTYILWNIVVLTGLPSVSEDSKDNVYNLALHALKWESDLGRHMNG